MQLTFLSEEPHANRSPSLVSERDWMIRVATSCSSMLPLLNDTGPDGWFGKTSPVSFQATEDETLQAFWQSSPGEGLKCLQAAGGMRDTSRMEKAHTVSHGECLTLSMSEWTGMDGLSLSDEGVSSLSDILETGDVPQRFYLSAKACRGILRRAEKRGKALPPQLARALQAVADSEPISTSMED